MRFWESFKSKFKNEAAPAAESAESTPIASTAVLRWLRDETSDDLAPDMGDATYYTCLKLLCEAMSKMPCYLRGKDGAKVTKGRLPYLVGLKPNEYQTAAEWLGYMEFCRNHYGNGYAVVVYRSDGEIEGIYPLNPLQVQVYVDNTNSFATKYFYQYTGNAGSHTIHPDNMIHLKNWYRRYENPIVGLPVKDVLHATLAGVKAGQRVQNRLFKQGMNPNSCLKYTGDMSKEARKKALLDLKEVAGVIDNRIFTVPMGWELTPLQLNLADSQFLETRKYTSAQIAAAMGIPSQMLNDYAKQSYASATAQQLAFLQSTLSYIIEIYEQELTAKLLTEKEFLKGMSIKFNLSSLLRADPVQQATMLRTYVDGSIYKINEARAYAGLPPIDGGDVLMKMPGADTIGGNQDDDKDTKVEP